MPPRKSRRKAPAATQQVETPPATQQDEATPATQQDEAPLASQLVEAPLKDYLCSYPAEVLIEILVHVDTKTFFDLVHTCAGLRDFLRNNAARICNRFVVSSCRLVPNRKQPGACQTRLYVLPQRAKLSKHSCGSWYSFSYSFHCLQNSTAARFAKQSRKLYPLLPLPSWVHQKLLET